MGVGGGGYELKSGSVRRSTIRGLHCARLKARRGRWSERGFEKHVRSVTESSATQVTEGREPLCVQPRSIPTCRPRWSRNPLLGSQNVAVSGYGMIVLLIAATACHPPHVPFHLSTCTESSTGYHTRAPLLMASVKTRIEKCKTGWDRSIYTPILETTITRAQVAELRASIDVSHHRASNRSCCLVSATLAWTAT